MFEVNNIHAKWPPFQEGKLKTLISRDLNCEQMGHHGLCLNQRNASISVPDRTNNLNRGMFDMIICLFVKTQQLLSYQVYFIVTHDFSEHHMLTSETTLIWNHYQGKGGTILVVTAKGLFVPDVDFRAKFIHINLNISIN